MFISSFHGHKFLSERTIKVMNTRVVVTCYTSSEEVFQTLFCPRLKYVIFKNFFPQEAAIKLKTVFYLRGHSSNVSAAKKRASFPLSFI